MREDVHIKFDMWRTYYSENSWLVPSAEAENPPVGDDMPVDPAS